MPTRTLRIFISSPGDVGQERLLATRVLDRLRGEFACYVELEPILWEHEPLRATGHFQEQIIPPSQCDIVVCILWSRLGTRLPPSFHREDGSLFASGTEWEFEDAYRSFRERGKPDLMVYRKTAEPHASISDEAALLQRLDQKKALDVFIDRWFGNPQEAFRAAFHAFEAPDQFETLLETHLRRLIRDRLPEHLEDGGDAAAASPVPISWHKGSPFRGLEAFDYEHAPVFFGRTRAIAGIKEALLRQARGGCAFVMVFGMSGCGKSSLVRAGVLPTLTQPGVVEGIGLWRWGVFRPTDATGDLCAGLAGALLGEKALPELKDAGMGPDELALLLQQAPERAVLPLEKALERAAAAVARKEGLSTPPQARLALIIDQLEEMFTRERVTPPERERFVHALSTLARSGLVWILATMRSDFYPRCADIPELAALKEGAGQYDVLPSTFAEVGQMIRNPARAAGLRFEVNPETGERLDDVLHEAAARDPEALPLLSFTLDELFQQRTENGVLTFAAYERLGGMEGALARRAEEVFAALPPAVEAALPFVLRGLVTTNQKNDDVAVARRVPLGGLATTPEREALVRAFIDARLLVTDRADDGQPVVRVAHEALLRQWPRVRHWLDEDREFLRTRERVLMAAERWREEAQRPEFLLPEGKPLASAEDMLLRRRDDLDRQAITFIEASRRAVSGARQRRRIVISGVVSAFFVVAAGFGLFSYAQWQAADLQKKTALTAVQRLTYDIPARLIDLPGSRPVLRRIFEENIALLDRIGDARAKSEQRTNLRYMGDIWLLLGDTTKAGEAYRRSLALAQDIARNGSDARAQWELAVAHSKIGDVRLQAGDPQGALAEYEKSLGILNGVARHIRNVRVQRDLGATYQKIGDSRLALNDAPGALEAYRKDLEVAQRLAAGEGADAGARRDLSVSHGKIGDVRRAMSDPRGALEAYRQSQAILLELVRDKRNVVAQRDLSACYLNVGDIRLEQGDIAGARTEYDKSLALCRRLARDRTNARAQRDLLVSYTKVGDVRLASGDARGAVAAYAESLTLARELADEAGDSGAWQDLKFVFERLRDARLQAGDQRAALQAHEQSLTVALRIAGNDASASARRERAGLYRDIGTTRRELGDLPGALAAYEKSLELYYELGRDKKNAQAQRDLAEAFAQVADLRREIGGKVDT